MRPPIIITRRDRHPWTYRDTVLVLAITAVTAVLIAAGQFLLTGAAFAAAAAIRLILARMPARNTTPTLPQIPARRTVVQAVTVLEIENPAEATNA